MLTKYARLIFLPEVTLPESKLVSNRRLGAFQRFMQLCVCFLVAYIIFVGQSYYVVEEPAGSVTNWVEWDPAAYEAQAAKDFGKDICRNTSEFDYVYDPLWSYVYDTCLEVSSSDRFRKEGAGSLYVPLSFSEKTERVRYLPPGANGTCASLPDACPGGWVEKPVKTQPGTACECTSEAFYLVVGQEAFTVNMEHYYELTRQATGHGSRQHSGSSCTTGRWWCEDKATEDELLTLVVIQNGQKEETFGEPFVSPSPIKLAIGDLVRGAGFSLDGYNTDTLHNYLKCDDPRANQTTCRPDAKPYPLVRITGMEIQLTLRYYNRHFFPDYPELRGHRGPVCIVGSRVIPMWTGRPTSECDRPKRVGEVEADCTGRYFYGISISFATHGRFGYLDAMQLLLTVGATISYFSVPGVIIYFLTLYCLGPSSDFYRRGVIEKFKMDDAFCSLVCNALTSSNAFRALANADGELTKEQVLAEVNAAFSTMKGFGLQEQAELSELVFDRLTAAEEDRGAKGDVAHASAIALPSFVQSSMNTGLGPTLHELFREDRRRWPLEYLFVPRSHIKAKRRAFKRSEGGGLDVEVLESQVEQAQGARDLQRLVLATEVLRAVKTAGDSDGESSRKESTTCTPRSSHEQEAAVPTKKSRDGSELADLVVEAARTDPVLASSSARRSTKAGARAGMLKQRSMKPSEEVGLQKALVKKAPKVDKGPKK